MVSTVWCGRSLRVIIGLNGTEFATDEDWADWMALVRGHLADDPQLLRSRSLVFSDGGSPTARQRREVIEACDGVRAIGSIVSSSRLVRGVGTALSWFMPEVKYFAPRDYRRALRHIGIEDDEEPGVFDVIQTANRRMGLEVVGELVRFESRFEI
jgi:hypothetical protein